MIRQLCESCARRVAVKAVSFAAAGVQPFAVCAECAPAAEPTVEPLQQTLELVQA
jgi:hypothetical protein